MRNCVKRISEQRSMTGNLTLYELNMLVRKVVETQIPHGYWVEAELSELREGRGHCYMELVQKDGDTNTPIARAQARCWRNVWAVLQPHFLRVTGQRLRAGMKVLLKVYAQFHENYGFSWIVTDINPEFTMGDMARKRMEIIRRLKAEGVFNLNKELRIPMFAQRIAVISSATAAGYGDFCNQLAENGYGFVFHTQLFESVMQGEDVEAGIISALNRINARLDDFDVAVITRGGGATADLSGFDTLGLAENVANFPLPVITGIGHDRDESILDMISNTRVKTPTAAAAFLIANLAATQERIEKARMAAAESIRRRMDSEKMRVSRLSTSIPLIFSLAKTRQDARLNRLSGRAGQAVLNRMSGERHRMERLSECLYPAAERILARQRHRIDMLTQRVKAQDPALLLKRGYSITLHNGKAVRDVSSLKPGDEIETRVEKGTIISVVAGK